jgi:hypothetical protein
VDQPVVVERVTTPRGELVLRRCGAHFELISNGVFLMDTRGGRSERVLVRAGLEACPHPSRLLIGGWASVLRWSRRSTILAFAR